MYKRWISVLLAVALLCPLCASAGGVLAGAGVADSYDLGMNCFYLEDYSTAAAHFGAAGNYRDAKKWAYYCQAIGHVLQSSGAATLDSAQVRFELLAAQNFEQAHQWAVYCKARAYEAQRSYAKAGDLYATILVHDSIERYLTCRNHSGALESTDSVRRRMRSTHLSADELYETGMNHYYLENYAAASDYFCLAGNYADARQWRCYCAAISMITEAGSLEDAQVLFALLETQGFDGAAQWSVYCRAREYENLRFVSNAIELYKSIFVHDSSERYLKLLGQ